MESIAARALTRDSYNRLSRTYTTVSRRIVSWGSAHLRPYVDEKKVKPPAQQQLLKAFHEIVEGEALTVYRESSFTVLSRFAPRAIAKAALIMASSGDTEWFAPPDGAATDADVGRQIGRERCFFLHTYAFIARKSRFFAYRTHLPLHLTFHTMQRVLERSNTKSVASFFDERLLRAVVLINPICFALLSRDCTVTQQALALPYGNGLLLAVPRRVKVTKPGEFEKWKHFADRRGFREVPLGNPKRDFIFKAHVNTYVDYDQLSEGQEDIARILNEFYDTFKDDLWRLFRLEHFYSFDRDGDETTLHDDIRDLYVRLIERLVPVLNHRYWQRNVHEPRENWLSREHDVLLRRLLVRREIA